MVSFKRLMGFFTLGIGILVYLVMAGSLEQRFSWIFLGVLCLLAILLTGTGGGRKVHRVRRRPAAGEEASDEEEEDSLPAPVVAEDDVSTRRDEKLARGRKGETLPEPEAEDEEVVVALADDEVAVSVIEENVHVAEAYVAEIDAESMEEADIEAFVDDRRERHALIRRRIEARRREQLAEIRAETAKRYQSADESEDILALLGTADHGQTVVEESLDLPAGSPVGAVFARIDDSRVMKIRIPLDQGFIASKEPAPELPPLPDLGDLPLPPPPMGGDLPPLPGLGDLPPPPSLSKLDAMREELDG